MKRLSINKPSIGLVKYRLCFSPKRLFYDNSGSFVEDQMGNRHKGTCIGCGDKRCIEYSYEELATPEFQAFPHNTSRRVCPSNAISFDLDKGCISINPTLCFACSLCVQRCPTAAIQFDFSNKRVIVNQDPEILMTCSDAEQKEFLANPTPSKIFSYSRIPAGFADYYQVSILQLSKRIPDISEVIVRNTLINMGIPCNVNAAGNNHNRTEFFGQQGEMMIIGESNSSDTDTLSVSRRILDDEAVLISRYGKSVHCILPLAVINGFPNKRTDYYEVVHDINAVLGIQIYTISFHVLFILNLFGVKLSIPGFRSFVIDSSHQDLLPAVNALIPGIDTIDNNSHGASYRPIK